MAAALDDLPEAEELLEFDLTVLVYVHLVEKFLGRNLAEPSFPVSHGLIHVNGVRVVRIE